MWFRVAFADIGVYYARMLGDAGARSQHIQTATRAHVQANIPGADDELCRIKQDAPLQYRIKLLRFTMRGIGYFVERSIQRYRLLKAIVGELFR